MRRPFARTFDLISQEYGWTDAQVLDLTMARMRQVRDVILTRRMEEEERRGRIEEAKVQAVTVAVYAAAGNAEGVKAASKFRLYEPDDDDPGAPVDPDNLPSTAAVSSLLGGVDPLFGLYTDEDIAAEAERLRAEQEQEPEVTWVVNRRAE